MPRAADPSLFGGLSIPMDRDPTARIGYQHAKPEFDLEAIFEQLRQFAEDFLFPVIEEMTGIDLTVLLPLLDGLIDGLSLITDALSALTSGDPTQLLAFFTEFASLDLLTSFPNLLFGLINGGQPINAGNLFGDIASSLLSEIGLGSVSNTAPNLLIAPNFPNSASIEANPLWVFDPAVTSEVDGSGSARTTCDGTLRVIRSTLVSVTEDQVVPISGKFKWTGLTFTGTPLAIGVREFYADGSTHDIEIAHVNSPGPAGGFTAVAGNYTPTAGAKKFYVRGIVKASATAGTVWFDSASATKPNTPNWFQPLLDLFGVGALDDFIGLDVEDIWSFVITTIMNPLSLLEDSLGRDQIQNVIDSVWGALTGGADTGNLLADLIAALRAIPGTNVTGTGGPASAASTFQSIFDQLVGGFVGTFGSGAGLADIFNVGQDVSSRASRGAMAFDIAGTRNNNPLTSGFLPTGKSNISLDQLVMTPGTVSITQSTALTNYTVIKESIDVGAISWQGSGVTSVTDAYVNLYKMDPVTGQNGGALHASTNQIGILSSSMQQNLYLLPSSVHFEPGDILGVEICIRGGGTHSVVGATSTLVDQAVYPRRWSSVRNSGTSAAPSTAWTPTYSNNVAFVEHALSTGIVPVPHSPQINTVTLVGGSSLPIPTWANTVQVITLGGGGGGRQGGTYGISGEGGDAGQYATGTWVRGTDFTGSPSISITVGAAGTGGSGVGGNGGNSTATITGHTVTSNGGEGGDALQGGGFDKDGHGAGNQAYGGVTYVGGPAQSNFGGNGAAPGGGGAGGNYISFQGGGYGAAGAVWIRFVQ